MAKRLDRRFICLLAMVGVVAVGAPSLGVARGDVAGSGKHKEDRRKIGGFDQVDVAGALEVQIEAGGAGSEIVVAGDDNLLPLVRTDVKDGRVRIFSEEGLKPKAGLTITVRLPALKGVEAAGAVRVTARGLNGDRLEVEVTGASKVELQGKVKTLDAEVSGASRLGAEALKADAVKIEANGASTAVVNARREVTGEASGASQVQVHGSPGTVKVETSGASSVSRKG